MWAAQAVFYWFYHVWLAFSLLLVKKGKKFESGSLFTAHSFAGSAHMLLQRNRCDGHTLFTLAYHRTLAISYPHVTGIELNDFEIVN